MDQQLTLKQLADKARTALVPHYSEGEAAALVREILFRTKGYTPVDLALNAQKPVSDYLKEKVMSITERLLLDEPIQQIFGIARFYGMDLKITPDVLIPRPETAELVDIIVKDFSDRSDLRVLDLCTGSGAIAIALARNLPFSIVEAIDISPAAIEVAAENAVKLKAKINFSTTDALKLTPKSTDTYDIIVANPPYITESEKPSVEPNVLLYEPHLALFVPDSDPLLFYRAIGLFAQQTLADNGRLYFEINPVFADSMKELLSAQGWADIRILPDSDGKRRFAIISETP